MLVLDPYSLQVLSETVVTIRDDNFADHGQDDYYDWDYNSFETDYPTGTGSDRIIWFDQGKYLLWPVTKSGFVAVYYWRIYNTETGQLEHSIKRVKELQELICDFKQSQDDPRSFYFAAYNQKQRIIVGILNLMTGDSKIISEITTSKNSCVSSLILSQSCEFVYAEFKVGENDTIMCKLYKADIRQRKSEIDCNFRKNHIATYHGYRNFFFNKKSIMISAMNLSNKGKDSVELINVIGDDVNSKPIPDFGLEYFSSTSGWVYESKKFTAILIIEPDYFKVIYIPYGKRVQKYEFIRREFEYTSFENSIIKTYKGTNELIWFNIHENKYFYK